VTIIAPEGEIKVAARAEHRLRTLIKVISANAQGSEWALIATET